MADEDTGGNLPIASSEVKPPHVDSSPEMASQRSSLDDQTASSSTDSQPPEIVDFSNEQSVSSTSDLEHPDCAGHSRWLPEDIRPCFETNEAVAVERSNFSNQRPPPAHEPENQPEPDALPYTILRRFLEAPPLIIHSEAQSMLIQAALDGVAVESAVVQATLEPARVQKAIGKGQIGLSQEITKSGINCIKKNIND